PAAGKNNVGDGTLRIVGTGYDTLTEAWTVTAVNSYSFIVTGSESGLQSRQYDIYANDKAYVTDNSEVRFKIDAGTIGFNTGDSFTFSTTAGTIVGETVTLTETDVDSGVFTGSIAVNEAATAVEGDGLLDIQTGDLITAVYNDAAGDWGDAEQVRTTALYAATVLPGATLIKDTVWTKENSPYLITGDITVSSDVTLTIMAGVEVLFLANSDDTSDGQNPYDSELLIDGNVVVAGSEDEKVILTSSNRNGEMGDWGGIRINSGSLSATHMRMEYSDYGIETYSIYNDDVFSVTHSELANNRQALNIFDTYNDSTVTVSHNHIHDNAGYALTANYGNATWAINNNTIENNGSSIYLYSLDDVTLHGNTITYNGNGGIQLEYLDGDVAITDNVISHNQGEGIYGYSYSWGNNANDYTATVTGNTVSDNSGNGISLTLSNHNTIDVSDNVVDANSGSGIRLYSESNTTRATVHNNTITNNGQDDYYSSVGLYISGYIVPSIVGNQIEGNGAGVFISYYENNGSEAFEISGNSIINNDDYGISLHNYANPVINGNDIYGNGGYALENHTSYGINAKNNWWGEEDTAEMNEGDNPKALSFIYDGNTDSSVGKVNYSNWATRSVNAKHVRHDVDGDGKADILWRNVDDGRNWMWKMNGLNIEESSGINVIYNQAWKIVGRGDFNGDGKSDILWRNHETGRNYIYLMDGFTIKKQGELNYVYDSGWKIKEVLDLNGDGKDDIIWRHTSRGDTWIYLMDGIKATTSTASLSVSDLGWQIVASGDVNGDGYDDVIWRHKTRGSNYIWLMEGTNIKKRYVLNTVNTNWDIAGVGDINGDGIDDIIWRNQVDGRNWAYLMKDGQIQTSALVNSVANIDWEIADIADLNGDGKDDIFWRQTQSGQSYIYLMNGLGIGDRGYGNTVGTQWKVMH
ncbi:FG-GAP-like repeat-containing protein, partial [Alteromonas gracilis]